SGKAAKANEAAVRWQPKEVLEETHADTPRFESDIYGLGVCMIEAKTDEVPFGTVDDHEVTGLIVSGQSHPRPDNLSDIEWDFISRLCHPDYTRRPNLDEVLEKLTAFAASEEQIYPTLKTIPVPTLDSVNDTRVPSVVGKLPPTMNFIDSAGTSS
ncbi:Serine/threonine protein kinase, partial [Phytophthora megakarya]